MAQRRRSESAKLRAALARAQMTQQAVADLLNTHQPVINARMRTGSWPPGDLEKLADALDCPLTDLLDDDQVPRGGWVRRQSANAR